MFFFGDYTIILIIPALLFTMWAQFKTQNTFAKYSKIGTFKGLTGQKVARLILNGNGLNNVEIEHISGNLTDHYDPQAKVLRLSDNVYDSDSISAIGVAAHEAGHAIQHSKDYIPLAFRNSIVPVANISSFLAFPLFLIGLLFSYPLLINLGIIFFSGAVVFHLVTLPVEYNASKRAIDILSNGNYLNAQELTGAKEVLNAAALTYVASALMALLNLFRLILISSRSRD